AFCGEEVPRLRFAPLGTTGKLVICDSPSLRGRASERGRGSKTPTHRRIGTEHDDALVAARHLDPLGRVERLGLQGDALLVDRQAVEARAVQAGEGFEPVERVL